MKKKTKTNTINLLKQKITAMQTELVALQAKKESIEKGSPSPRRPCRINMNRSPKNQNYKSPTFWNKNPITNDDKYSPTKRASPSPNRTSGHRQLEKSMSPNLKCILKSIDLNYYGSKSTQQLQVPEQKVQPKKHSYIGKRFENNYFGQERYFDQRKESKIRTYQTKKTDVILNPEKYKSGGVKQVIKLAASPQHMLTEHPRSSQQVYTFPNQTILLQKKGCVRDRNVSTLSLSSSLGELIPIKFDENKVTKRQRSQKKHMVQYFRDNFCSQIDFE